MTPSEIDNLQELAEENLRLKTTQDTGKGATIMVWAVIIMCAMTVGAVVLLTIMRPDRDNTGVITTIVGIVSPVILALLAGAVQRVHLAVNSRLSQLLELTAASAKAKGILQEKERVDPGTIAAPPLPPA